MPLPIFPKFKQLTLSDREEFQTIVKKFPPSSDFNLAGLWSYNIDDDARVSLLNNNLILKLGDYITNEPFYTYLGTNRLEETIIKILEFCKESNVTQQLKLILKISLPHNKKIKEKFLIKEDRDNFDYIYSLEEMSLLIGSKYQKQRGWINKLLKTYPEIQVTQMNMDDPMQKEKLTDLFLLWGKNKKLKTQETDHELVALKRIFKSEKYFNIITLGIFHKNKLIGFTVSEVLNNKYSIMHFAKADIDYPGVFQLLFRETAKMHLQKGSIYLNREQDLGISSLRAAKTSWNPITYLKKYKISKK